MNEILSGSWYRHAYQTLITNPNKQFLIPIILYIDKTVVSEKSQFSSHPVMFTIAIFDRKTRNQHNAWKPLGYIHNPHIKSNRQKPKGK